MNLNGKNVTALVLIGIGALALLPVVMSGVAWILKWLFPIVLMVLGYYGMKRGKTFIGLAVFIIGAAMLFSKLSGVFGIILAVALIIAGISLLKKRNAYTSS